MLNYLKIYKARTENAVALKVKNNIGWLTLGNSWEYFVEHSITNFLFFKKQIVLTQ